MTSDVAKQPDAASATSDEVRDNPKPLPNQRAETIALRPCPFCGSEPRVSRFMTESLWSHNQVEYLSIACLDCDGADMSSEVHDELIEKWNTRVPLNGGGEEALREAADKLVNQFAWSAVQADCTEANVYLTELINGVRAALATLNVQGGEAVFEAVANDGQHKPGEMRRWLARQLMDSKLEDDEAFGIVAFHPCITDAALSVSAPPVVVGKQGLSASQTTDQPPQSGCGAVARTDTDDQSSQEKR